jgi:hypothetical protein
MPNPQDICIPYILSYDVFRDPTMWKTLHYQAAKCYITWYIHIPPGF